MRKGSSGLSGDSDEKYLGDFKISLQKFEDLPRIFKEFQGKEFHKLNDKQKTEKVNHVLHDLILKAKIPCFLLAAVIDFIEQINALHILESYAFFHFELWLNQFSHLSNEDNYLIRAKIMGKWVPRDEFQILFPIGMGKMYAGSHFVTAHSSPDIDTTVASFWGWVDAFTARVSDGLHLWNVPGGAPTSQIEIGLLFNQLFGDGIFHLLAKTRTTLSLSGIDLMTQKGLVRKHINESALMIDHDRMQNAFVLIDDEGYYLGDWLNFDGESVRQVILMLGNCLRWFEGHLHASLIALFARTSLTLKDLPAFVSEISLVKLKSCQPVQELTEKQRKHLHDYLVKVLRVEKGLECSFAEFAKAMNDLSLFSFQEFVDLVEKLDQSALFDRSGTLVENRTMIFNYLRRSSKVWTMPF
jgi:hypothetical protein